MGTNGGKRDALITARSFPRAYRILFWFAIDWLVDRHNARILAKRNVRDVEAAWQRVAIDTEIVRQVRAIISERQGPQFAKCLPTDSIEAAFQCGDISMSDVDIITSLVDRGLIRDLNECLTLTTIDVTVEQFMKKCCVRPIG